MQNIGSVPLFPGVESTEDLLITTLEELDKMVVDVVRFNHPLFLAYKAKNAIKYPEQIGLSVNVKLLDKENTTVKEISHYDDLDLTPQDALSQAQFAYGYQSGVQMYSRQELVQNANNIVDLVEVKQDQLLTSMNNRFGSVLMGSQDSDGRIGMGMGRIFAYDQSCGGITPTTPGYEYWNPQQGLKTTGAQYALATEFGAGRRRLARLCTYNGEIPDLVLAGEDVMDAFESQMEGLVRFDYKGMGSDKPEVQKAFSQLTAFDYRGALWVYDADMSAKTAWFINTKRAPLRIHKGTNFQMGQWQTVPGKEAKYRSCLTYYSLACERRDAHGYITYS